MDFQWCLQTLRRVVSDLSQFEDWTGRRRESAFLDSCQVQLDLVYRELVAAELLGQLDLAAVDLVRLALVTVERELDGDNQQSGYQAPIVRDGSVGRPQFDIPRNQLVYLLEKRFTVPDISEILQVSVRTVRRRMSAYELSVSNLYSTLTDQQLDGIVQDIQYQFPTCQMMGHLLARGIRVQQFRVREAQKRIDPSGSIMRRFRTIDRRTYRVNGPGALWHIDGNHKLIRYDVMCMERDNFSTSLALATQRYEIGDLKSFCCWNVSFI